MFEQAVRTSVTDPMRYNYLSVPGCSGRLALTICPGKRGDSMYGANWNRDLAIDMQSIAGQEASALVSLIEHQEAVLLGVPSLAESVPVGIAHYWLPIVDQRAPDQRWMHTWPTPSVHLHEILDQGGLIIIHCRGGLGRAGTVAAMLLVERGVEPDDAIDHVREARPRAIETNAQETFIRRLEPGGRRGADQATEPRFVGCLLAGAMGDALGASVEFSSRAEIFARHGFPGIVEPDNAYGRPGLITDDTQMAMFTAEALVASRLVPGVSLDDIDSAQIVPRLGQAYQYWLITQGETGPLSRCLAKRESNQDSMALPYARSFLMGLPEMHARRAPGNTCLSALQTMRGFCELATNNSKGCGTVIRVAPVGLFIASIGGPAGLRANKHTRTKAIVLAYELGVASAALTHGHPAGQHSAGVIAVLICLLAVGFDADRALAELSVLLDSKPEAADIAERLRAVDSECEMTARRIAAGDNAFVVHAEALASLGEGWTADEAMAMAVYCLRTARTVEEALVIAVNIDGDSDSVGAIAGHLMGANLGLPDSIRVPSGRVELRNELIRLSQSLHSGFAL